MKLRIETALAVFLLGASNLVCLYATQPILPALGEWSNLSAVTAAWTLSATTLGVALTAPVVGLITEHRKRKEVIVIAMAALLATTALAALAWSFTSLLVMRFAQGICIPFIFSSAVTYIAEQWSDRQAVRYNSIYIAGTAFGGFSGRFFAALMVDLTGNWRAAFVALLCLLIIILIVNVKWLPTETGKKNYQDDYAFLPAFSTLGKDIKVLASCVIAFSLLFQQSASFTFISLMLVVEPFNLSNTQVGLIFLVFLVPAFLTPLMSWFINKFGYPTAFAIASIVGGIGLLMTLSPQVWIIVSGLTFSCLSVFSAHACATGFMVSYCTQFKTVAVGIYLLAYYLGGAAGAVVPAKIYQNFGWSGCVYLLLTLILSSICLALASWRRLN